MKPSISHKGIVTKSGDGYITVKISPEANECVGCAISGVCSKAEEINVPYAGDGPSLIGRNVLITSSMGLQRSATMMFFVIPVLLLIGMLVILISLDLSESTASLISLLTVGVWYLVIFILYNKNKKNYKAGWTLSLLD